MTIETEYRRISTPIPHPDDLALLDELRKVESTAVPKQLPIWTWADDFNVYDNYKNMFLDFTSGIFVANLGHRPAIIGSAVGNEALLHTYSFVNMSRMRFLKKLIDITPDFAEKACLFSAGTEATEAAVKIMRGYSSNERIDGHIMSLQGSMHGNTYIAKRMGGWEPYLSQDRNDDLDDIILDLPFLGDIIELLEYEDSDPVCGIMIESYQGWSAKFHDVEAIQLIVKLANEQNVPVCFDEIQGGFGRTGKMFAYEHYDVEPDLVCLGKGLTGSLPVSAVIGRAKYMDCLPEGELSSTHSGNPVGCAAGLANLEEFSKDDFAIVEKSRVNGNVLGNALNDLKNKYPDIIVEINGHGLLAGIITKTKEQSDRVCEMAKQRGLLLVHTGRESIKIGPPLTIPMLALIEGIEVIDECLGEL